MQNNLSLKHVLIIATLLSVSALVAFVITSSSPILIVNLHAFTHTQTHEMVGPKIAHADHSATRCSIDIRGERYPITYLNESRQNPDATYYPGDGFYYLLRYTDRTSPEQCFLHTPIIESANLYLNHTAVYRGEESTGDDGRVHVQKIKYNTPVVHTGHNLSVELVKTNHYHYAERMPEDTCRHHCEWQNCPYLFYHHYVMYEEPFLSKKGDLNYAEQKSARSKSSGSTITDIWIANDWKGINSKKARQPYCADMGKMRNLDLATGVGHIRNSGIINQPTYTWEIVKNNPASHNDTFVSYADPNSRERFEERVKAMCHTDRLPADSGCVYGTVEIMPRAEILCVHDNLRTRGINFTAPPETGTPGGKYIIPENKCSSPINLQETTGSGGTLFNFTIKGTYLTPFHTAGNINPLRAIKTVTEDFAPPMQNNTLQVLLSKPPLHHHDGQYNAKNQDGTYYHHDPLYIYHEPSWVWKDQRYKHINFTLQRYHNVLPTEDKFHCINTTETFPCTHWTKLQGLNSMWLNETIQYGNGDGMTAHNATVGFAFDKYDFFYEMSAFNLNRHIRDGNGTTSAVVVDYNPLYDMVYSYPVLRDGAEYMYDDRRGIVMKYAGSWQEDFWPHETVEKIMPKTLANGTVVNATIWVPSTHYSVLSAEALVKKASNDADEQPVLTDKILWPERRSLINGWKHQGVAYDYFAKSVNFATTEPHLLSEARDVTPGNITALWYNSATTTSSVMFAQDGYGVVLWDWPVGDYVFGLKDNAINNNVGNITNTTNGETIQVVKQQQQQIPDGGAKYENMSSHLDTYSWNFAGKLETPLYQSLMRYTDVPFGKQILIRSIDQNGTTQVGDTITLRVLPSGIMMKNGTTSVGDDDNDASVNMDDDDDDDDSVVKVEVDINNTNNTVNSTNNGTSITTEYLANYIRDKITHDTSDNQVFIDTILNDTHQMQQEWKSTSGFLDVIVLRNSVLFDDFTTTPEMIAAHQEYVETYYEDAVNATSSLPSSLPKDSGEIVEQITDTTATLTEEVSSVLSEPPPPQVIPWESLFPTVEKSPFDFFTDLLDSIIVHNDKEDAKPTVLRVSSKEHATQTPYVEHPDKLDNNYGQPLSGINDEQTILALYSANNLESFRLNLPYHMGLGLPSPTTLYVSINGGAERVFDSKYYTFGGLENITINVRKDNTATVERDLGRLIIAQPENFGLIKKVKVNNVTIPINNCTHSNGCIVNIQQNTNEPVHTVLYNEWGGEAHSNSESIVPTAPMIVEPPGWQITILVLVGLVMLYVGYKQVKKMNL